MNSHFYPLYQFLGWLGLYGAIMLTIKANAMYSHIELLYGAILVSAAAGYSHLSRLGFKRWLATSAMSWQLFYFVFQALIGASLATLILIASVFAIAYAGWSDPIASHHKMQIFHLIFWGNASNMLVALLLWGALYLTLIKARHVREIKTALVDSQLKVLTQQLNPHFLFNLLNNIRALILEDKNRAREALAGLADILRYSLQVTEKQQVTLAQELEVVQEYVALCQIQYEDRLRLELDIEVDRQQVIIPCMLLQLAVENAIKHGIAPLPTGGIIHIQIYQQAKQLMINITNPINQQVQVNKQHNLGIGLSNIKKRLALLYADKDSALEADIRLSIDLESEDGIGHALTQIKLPLMQQEPVT